MNPELESKLSEKYPKLFEGKVLPPTESLMCFGCECEDGWYSILDNLCGFINYTLSQTYTAPVKDEFFEKGNTEKNYQLVPAPEVHFTQIKEKYGTLRVYYYLKIPDGSKFEDWSKLDHDALERLYYKIDQQIQSVIDFSEYLSSQTCEVTGKPGSLCKKGSWLKTLCPEKAEELGYSVDILDETE